MKKYWNLLKEKIDSRNQRERTLIAAMTVAVVVALFNALLLDPVLQKRKNLDREFRQQQDQLQTLHSQLEAIVKGGKQDPDMATKAALASLGQRLQQTHASLQNMQQDLIPPEKMARLLEDLLRQNGALQLVSLKTLPVSGVLDGPGTAAAKPSDEASARQAEDEPAAVPALYKHGVEITVAGSYAELTRYLDSLEQLPWRMIWGKADLKVDNYPRIVFTITVYTLSVDRTWLSV